MNFLAIIGILFLFLLGTVSALIILRHVLIVVARKKRKTNLPWSSTANPVQNEDKPAFSAAARLDRMSIYFESYNNLYSKLNIPPEAETVVKCTTVFILENVNLAHYFWQEEDILYFFPTWESIQLSFESLDYIKDPAIEDLNRIFAWKIPARYIQHYTIDYKNQVLDLYFKDINGRKYKTTFLYGAVDLFKKLFPEKDSEIILRRRYYGSQDYILDVKKELESLSAQLDSSLITTEAYEKKKREILSR